MVTLDVGNFTAGCRLLEVERLLSGGGELGHRCADGLAAAPDFSHPAAQYGFVRTADQLSVIDLRRAIEVHERILPTAAAGVLGEDTAACAASRSSMLPLARRAQDSSRARVSWAWTWGG